MNFRNMILVFALLLATCGTMQAQKTQVIAHRGYWSTPGSAQNSLAALVKADSINCYGSEFDVWLTADNQLVVNHDETFKGVTLQDATAQACTAIKLDNSEQLPTLQQYLDKAKTLKTRLILELKPHKTPEQETRAVEGIVTLIKNMGVEKRTEYITFSKHATKEFIRLAPKGTPVYYLTGDVAPSELKEWGCAGPDYHFSVFRKNPEWIKECHKLGMKVNAWTVNNVEDMEWLIAQEVDFITTNEPVVLKATLASLPAAQTALQQKISTISAITETKPLESTEFTEKYVTYFTQPLDHRHPQKGSFRQRVIVAHVGFDRPTVIVTEGYGAAYALSPTYREELSKLLNANMIFVEHRYFLESTPEPKEWQYLTAENSADDLHAITTAFKNLYSGKWIATGISKGGQTTLLYRTFYPNDVDISVPYVAPLCYAAEDGRHEPFLKKVSTAENRKKIEDFQLEVLKRKATLLPRFEKYCEEKELKFCAPIEEIYDYSVLEYSFAFWQWGTPISTIPLVTASDDEIFAHLLGISNPDYFIADSPTASFFVQAARELGYYGYDVRPFKKYLSIKSSKGYLHRLMLPKEAKDTSFDKTLSQKITKFLKENDPKIIFIYGQNDPWTAAGVTKLKGKKNIHVFIEPHGSHRARINTLPKAEKEKALALIREIVIGD